MTRHLALSLFLLVPRAATAESPEELFKKGIAQFERGEWRRAAKSLTTAAPQLKDPRARAVGYRQAGLAFVELKQPSAAEEAFLLAITADPLVDINPVDDPPRAVALFRAIRDRLDEPVTVSTDRPGARVYIDGADRGGSPVSTRLRIGEHSIRAETPDRHFAADATPIVVFVGKQSTVRLVLLPRVAFLSVAGPAGNEVLVDGATVGQTPLARVAVQPGKRRVTVRGANAEPKVVDADLAAGQEFAVDGTLAARALPEPKPARIDPIVSIPDPIRATPLVRENPRRTRPVAWASLGTAVAALGVGAALYFGASAPTNTESRDAYVSAGESYNTRVAVGSGLLIAGAIVGGASVALFLLHRDGEPRAAIGFGVFGPSGEGAPGVRVAVRY